MEVSWANKPKCMSILRKEMQHFHLALHLSDATTFVHKFLPPMSLLADAHTVFTHVTFILFPQPTKSFWQCITSFWAFNNAKTAQRSLTWPRKGTLNDTISWTKIGSSNVLFSDVVSNHVLLNKHSKTSRNSMYKVRHTQASLLALEKVFRSTSLWHAYRATNFALKCGPYVQTTTVLRVFF